MSKEPEQGVYKSIYAMRKEKGINYSENMENGIEVKRIENKEDRFHVKRA